MPTAVDNPVMIPLSDEERESGILTDEHLFDAVDGFFRDGVIVLKNAIDVGVIDELNERMKDDTAKIVSGAIKVHWNQGADKGNVSQVPPIEKDYLYPQIYANKAASQVLTNVLGPRPELRYIRSNTLLGNTTNRQRVHKDVKFNHLTHPFAVAMNVCLVDVGPENGSTEIWLGTSVSSPWEDHVSPTLGFIRDDKLEERRKIRPPVYPTIPKGSLVLRDLRVWHAGMPNHTPETRVMLAFVYLASWYKNTVTQKVPASLKPDFEALEAANNTKIGVEYVSEEEAADYLGTEFSPNFISSLQTI